MKTKQTKTFEKKLNEAKKKRKINPKLTVISPSRITYQFTNRKELKNCLKQIKEAEPEIYISFNRKEFKALFSLIQVINGDIDYRVMNDLMRKHLKEFKILYKKLDALLPQKKEKK